MASNYEDVCRKNREDYGKKGAKKSGDLAAGLYDDETHFIYELLQNAEDALKRRGDGWRGSRQVSFTLSDTRLEVSHYGHPFTENDVRSVCDISESTKDEDSIGRFGLGFKSVYKVSDLPEIHSGDEDFVIEGYVFPRRADKTARDADETQIFLPLRQDAAALKDRIAAGLKALGATSLLFLRHIREVSWSIEGGAAGLYLRDEPEALGDNVSRIKVIGQASGVADIDQDWMVFHRDVGKGRVELAFSVITEEGAKNSWTVQPLPASPLVVFFPTAHATHLGFYLQGPFQSTPSRDNIRSDDPWNHRVLAEAASLLVEAMTWLRDNKRLDINALRCLPMDRAKFPEGGMLTPLFDAVLQAFQNDAFLPNVSDGYSKAGQAKLGRTSDLRDLFDSEQLSALYGEPGTEWLTGEITQDKANDLRIYVTKELGVREVTPRDIFLKLPKAFMEAQPDEWISRVYEYLSTQAAVRLEMRASPVIRLEGGSHVTAKASDGEPGAFLPAGTSTGFPTVKAAVCRSEKAIDFLKSIGIGEPDPVDDVIRNVLPKYDAETVEIDDDAYASDIAKVVSAYQTDSAIKRSQLTERLRRTPFLMVVDCGDDSGYKEVPSSTYIATDRMKRLFAGIEDIFVVDDDYDCLRGEDVRNVLVASGASRYLRPEEIRNSLTFAERRELQIASGYPRSSYRTDTDQDWAIKGFDRIIALLPCLSIECRLERAKLIWETLEELESNVAKHFFTGTYWWSNRGNYHAAFPSSFIRLLTESSWVPNSRGDLFPPKLITFEETGWKANPFLLSNIPFKPSAIDQLAKEADVDPAALDILRKHKLTAADLAAWLAEKSGISQPSEEDSAPPVAEQPTASVHADDASLVPLGSVYDENKDLYGEDMPDGPESSYDPDGDDVESGRSDRPANGHPGHSAASGGGSPGTGGGNHSGRTTSGDSQSATREHGKRTPGSLGGRPFISYVGAHPEAEEDDPDGLNQSQRMDIEAAAIAHILEAEQHLYATEAGNAGFDLLEKDAGNQPVRWVEVKAMTGSLEHRPVTLSHTQFEHAIQKRDAYWLYVVEFATTPERRRILRIQNPAGNAKSFTFDKGWTEIALTSRPG
ncbi:MAG: DUF3883 domain-containing protein [Pseudoxanthomonas mexicana]|nr:DUF3883 domain-containing protein [Pseudoxanthomonas mexicana]